MISIAVVYHSGFGHTQKLAEAVTRGAQSLETAQVFCYAVEELDNTAWETLNAADAIVFGAPTYMGAVSADFKAFMDRSGQIWLHQRWKDKLAAGFTTSGSYSGDKLAVLQQLAGFAAQHGMIWISLGLQPGDAPEDEPNTHVLNRFGSYLGAMARSTNDSPDVTPPKGDLDTAYHLGRRVAEIAQRFKVGEQVLTQRTAAAHKLQN
ncbi:MAG: flavodoxin family protein [Bacteroidota bacterium]|nr:flavodoxin family protein [Candidatus Kapabacteria bacterium]MDW8221233.1 flavodoxin family protein [Bacteroidota bacterium]